jgi:hypothetical protein
LGFVNASDGDSETNSGTAEKATEFDTQELLKNLEAKYHEVAAETLESEKDLVSYLSLGKNEFFAGLEEDSPDDTYRIVDNLWNGYPKDEDIECLPKRGRDWDDDVSLNQLSLYDSRFSDGNNPCSSSSRRNESVSIGLDLSSSEHRESSSPEKLKEIAIKRLITDMGDDLFCYIPPRVKVKRLDYLQYVRKKRRWSIDIRGSCRLLHSFAGLC